MSEQLLRKDNSTEGGRESSSPRANGVEPSTNDRAMETTSEPNSTNFSDEMQVKSWTASYLDAAKASTPTILTMIFF